MNEVIKYLSHTKAIILLMIRKVIKYLSHTKAIILLMIGKVIKYVSYKSNSIVNDTEGN